MGKVIQDERLRRNLTQSQLARLTGISPGLHARLERGECQLSLGLLLRLANALDCSATELVILVEEGLRDDEAMS